MRQLINDGVKVQTCVTSPPYWGLRDYGGEDQIGCEKSLDEYITNIVGVFRLVRELLSDDGTLWINLGDTYLAQQGSGFNGNKRLPDQDRDITSKVKSHLKPKNLVGVPWHVAFALQMDGWYLRSDIIWAKPNPMPESVTDRPTKSHEYIFLLSKAARYYYDAESIREPASNNTHARRSRVSSENKSIPTKSRNGIRPRKMSGPGEGIKNNKSMDDALTVMPDTRNKRDVWTVASKPYSGAHFSTYPPELIEPCILAGSRVGDIVIDPFIGSGTTGEVAQILGRFWIGCELHQENEKLQKNRTRQQAMVL